MVYVIVWGDALIYGDVSFFATVRLGQKKSCRAHEHGILVKVTYVGPRFPARVRVDPRHIYIGEFILRHRLVSPRRLGRAGAHLYLRTRTGARVYVSCLRPW